jgi:protein SCO1/2
LYGGGLPDWTLLTASQADTATLWKYFGVFYKRVKEPKVASIDWFTHKPLTYDVAHADDLIFLDASGRERFVVNAEPNVQGALPPRRLVRPLTAEGMKALRRPNPVDSWTVAQGLSVFSWLLNTRLSVPT